LMLKLPQFEHFHRPSIELESFVYGTDSAHGHNGCVTTSSDRDVLATLDADYIQGSRCRLDNDVGPDFRRFLGEDIPILPEKPRPQLGRPAWYCRLPAEHHEWPSSHRFWSLPVHTSLKPDSNDRYRRHQGIGSRQESHWCCSRRAEEYVPPQF